MFYIIAPIILGLLIFSKEARVSAIIFFMAFILSNIIYNNMESHGINWTYHYPITATIHCVIVMLLVRFGEKYSDLLYKLSMAAIFINLLGWIMYENYIEPIYYNWSSTIVTLLQLSIITWSWPSGRNFIQSRYNAMVCYIISKSKFVYSKEAAKKGQAR